MKKITFEENINNLHYNLNMIVENILIENIINYIKYQYEYNKILKNKLDINCEWEITHDDHEINENGESMQVLQVGTHYLETDLLRFISGFYIVINHTYGFTELRFYNIVNDESMDYYFEEYIDTNIKYDTLMSTEDFLVSDIIE